MEEKLSNSLAPLTMIYYHMVHYSSLSLISNHHSEMNEVLFDEKVYLLCSKG